MNVHERALAVMSLKDVDEVIIGCPWRITRDLIISLRIDVVLQGSINEKSNYGLGTDVVAQEYEVAAEMGKFATFESPSTMTTQCV